MESAQVRSLGEDRGNLPTSCLTPSCSSVIFTSRTYWLSCPPPPVITSCLDHSNRLWSPAAFSTLPFFPHPFWIRKRWWSFQNTGLISEPYLQNTPMASQGPENKSESCMSHNTFNVIWILLTFPVPFSPLPRSVAATLTFLILTSGKCQLSFPALGRLFLADVLVNADPSLRTHQLA